MRGFVAFATILLLCGSILAATGPIDKGSMVVDATVYFQSQSGELYENTNGDGFTSYGLGNGSIDLTLSFMVNPTFGYFVAPGVLVGGQFAVIGISQGDLSATAFAIGPTVGYFFNIDPSRTNPVGAVYPYVRGFFNYGSLSQDFLGEKITITQFGANGGILYMLTRAVAIDTGVRFQSDSWKSDSANESVSGTMISFGAGISAFIY